MNETKNVEMLYDINEAVRNLNKVEGFEPKKYLREETTDEGKSFYLDTKFRLLWYRLKYPEGKLIKIPKALNKEYATFEVRVYSHKEDHPDNFLANGFASRYKDDGNEKFGLNFVESAETAALGRALKDAGFGTQFCDIALPNDQTVVDAGVNISFDLGNEELPNPDEDGAPFDDAVNETSGEDASTKPSTSATEVEETKAEEKLNLTNKMSVDEILGKITTEYAESIVVNYGYDSGKTLGRLAVEKPQSIEFHAARSKDNLIKAGAMYLLQQARQA